MFTRAAVTVKRYCFALLCVAVAALRVFGDSSGAPADNGVMNRFALLVGANSGGGDLERLLYAEADAERFAEVLRTVGEFPTRQVRVLRQPDSAALEREFLSVKKKIASAVASGGKTMFLLYYSGHSDGASLLLGGSVYPLRRVKAFLDSCGADLRVGVFDACHSGAMVAFKGGKAAEPFYFRREENARGQVIIAASSVGQAAQESDALGGSVFTHHWLNGLRGSADVIGSRYVTLNDAYGYAYRKTVETSAISGGGVQYPTYNFNIQGDGEIRLTNLNTSKEGILLDKSCEGAFIIHSERGSNVAADFTKQKGTEVFIAQGTGQYKVINTRSGDVLAHDVTVKKGSVEQLSSSMFITRQVSVETRRKGDVPRRAEYPQRKGFGYGVGGGVIASYPVEGNGQAMLNVAGVYNAASDLQIFANARAMPFGRQASADVGVNLYWESGDYSVYTGAGPSILYDYAMKEKRSEYAIRAQVGFAAAKSEKIDIHAQIPIILLLSGDNSIRSGLEVMFLFWR
jgi:hypothetical protein